MKIHAIPRKSLPLPPGFQRRGTIHSAMLASSSPTKKSSTLGLKKRESHDFEDMEEKKKGKLSKLDVGILIQDFQMIYLELKARLRKVSL
jgi:hypothetical protein